MTRATRWRIGSTVVVGAIVALTMVLFGMEPRLALVACIVAAAGSATWLVVDLAEATSPVVWSDGAVVPDTAATTDRRVLALRGWLRRPSRRSRLRGVVVEDGSASTDEIAEALLAVVADVLAEHGVDPTSDHDAVTELVGAELARFVGDPAARRSMTQRRTLAHTLALIEDLPSSP